MNLSLEIRRIEIPLRNANGSQISEHTRCQKLFLVLRRVIYASVRSQKVAFSSISDFFSGHGEGGGSAGGGEVLVEEMLMDLCQV